MARNDFDPVDLGDAELAMEPQRTSILAILSLICALICIIPGMGLLATVLGISAAVGISGSRGRVGGMGLAIAGIVLGLLFSMIWVGVLLGARSVMKGYQTEFSAPVSQVITALDTGDYANSRALFTPGANALITDDQLKTFRDAYQAKVGPFKGMPQSMVELIMGYKDVGPSMQNFQGRPDLVPLWGNFDKGPAVIAFQKDMRGWTGTGKPTPAQLILPTVNIIIVAPDGTAIELIPSNMPGITSPPPPPPTTPTTPDTPTPAPAPAPAEGEKKDPGSGG